ncbi:hypothetical protein [Sphingobium sp. HWE2-09]|uniref:hypothetical protein n=1 Tax=Sphingobium sp. HWE2-09 TaxID=3108390 RepID=UPI002DC097B2|nr:hypothetical protein [Sphingobium sp. HWE2-09]
MDVASIAKVDDVGSELIDLIEAAVDLCNVNGALGLEAFSLAHALRHDDERESWQVRAVSSNSPSGCEFRFAVQPEAVGQDDAASLARSILDAAELFTALEDLDVAAEGDRVAAERLAASTADGTRPMRVVAIGLLVSPNGGTDWILDVDALGDDLQLRTYRIHQGSKPSFDQELELLVSRHRKRQPLRDLAAASRAIGWMDEAALRIIEVAGLQTDQVIAGLRRHPHVEFPFERMQGQHRTACLFWRDGVIFGSVSPRADGERFSEDELVLPDISLPDTVLAAWQGRRFGDLATHRLVPSDAVVTRVQAVSGHIWIKIVSPRRPVAETCGMVADLLV